MPARTLAEMLQIVPALMEQCCGGDPHSDQTLKTLRLVDKMTCSAAVGGIKWCKFSTGEPPSSTLLLQVVKGAQLSKLQVDVVNCTGDGAGE